MERSSPSKVRMVPGASSWARALAHACTSDGRTADRRRVPSRVPAMWTSIRLDTRRAVVGRCGRVAAHARAYSVTVVRSLWSTYCPRSLSASTVAANRSASPFRRKVRLRCFPSGSRNRTSQTLASLPSRRVSRCSTLATSALRAGRTLVRQHLLDDLVVGAHVIGLLLLFGSRRPVLLRWHIPEVPPRIAAGRAERSPNPPADRRR